MKAALMVQGTASGVGKSLLTTALCRIYARRGLVVRPFKAQNMSNNAAVTADGGEIGRAQWLQAVAAKAEPDVRMNPILLKPLADTLSDVVVLGKSDVSLRNVHWHARREILWPHVVSSLESLRQEADLVVIEGAGSPAETNLRHTDIVNMAVAHAADAEVMLVADIDRGGAFAALFGTWSLLDDADRSRVSAFALNRFRGDASLLAPAPEDLTARTGVPVVGVVPYVRHLLPEEDAVGIASIGEGDVTIAAVRFPHIANFDDLDPLAGETGVRVQWTQRADQIAAADVIIVPGTRNTLADLRWSWETGVAAAIRSAHASGTPVMGLCGGYQMMGREVSDPAGIEGGGRCEGFALLDAATELAEGKTTRQARVRVVGAPDGMADLTGRILDGYEIHHGVTAIGGCTQPWMRGTGDHSPEILGGFDGTACGTYLHGLFGNDELRRAWLASLRAAATEESWRERLDREIERIADVVESSLDATFLARFGARR
jgi:adenosylcobyric acid synthase